MVMKLIEKSCSSSSPFPMAIQPLVILKTSLFIILVLLYSAAQGYCADEITDDKFFILDNGVSLRAMGDSHTRRLLTRVHGKGHTFGARQKKHYCKLKQGKKEIQWVLNNLETGEIISRSDNAEVIYFGASSSKIFVAAAVLDKQGGTFSKSQLRLIADMIVKSGNPPWIALQRQAGDDGTDDSGRLAVEAFTQKMGYTQTRGFQGWLTKKDGTRVHGNELNTMELSKFLYDTYHRKYPGADVLWKIMHATKTGSMKIDKYTPKNIYIAGKTGTYSGNNASPETVKLKSIKAKNHVAAITNNNIPYGLSILSNTGSNEDVAVLGGGLMREYLDIGETITCENAK